MIKQRRLDVKKNQYLSQKIWSVFPNPYVPIVDIGFKVKVASSPIEENIILNWIKFLPNFLYIIAQQPSTVG